MCDEWDENFVTSNLPKAANRQIFDKIRIYKICQSINDQGNKTEYGL